MTSSLRSLATTSLLLIVGGISSTAFGQQTVQTLPDSPGSLLALNQPTVTNEAFSSSANDEAAAGTQEQKDQTPVQAATSPEEPDQSGQTKRILGIFPNFRSVSANQHLPPQSVKEKLLTAAQDSFDYSSFVVPAFLAGFDQARNATPEFRQGAAGYGRYFWHSFADQTDENLWVEFIIPAIAHEDTRYYTLGSGGFKKRALYAVKHVVVTRNDAGKDVFNSGEVVGSAISAGLSNLYYPAPERTASNTIQQWGTSLGIDCFTFALREFWPDVNHRLFHGARPSTK